MFMTGRRDYRANRWEAFVREIAFESLDFTGATFAAQVRAVKDSGGAPLANLANVASPTLEGIAIVSVVTTGGVPTTTISLRIAEATMEAMPEPVEMGDDIDLNWDLQITPVGDDKFRALEGLFTVHAGVTH